MPTPETIDSAAVDSMPAGVIHRLNSWALMGDLVAFALPLSACIYLFTGPHRWYGSLFFLAIPIGLGFIDAFSGPDRVPPPPVSTGWFFNSILYGLSALQVINIARLPFMLRNVPLFSLETALAILIVGGASGYCGLVVAHELIHRRARAQRWLGRLLLSTSLFDHFSLEHIPVHHALLGTPDDVTTARFGESFLHYLWHATWGQIRGAWRIERKRLSSRGMRGPIVLALRNGVTHGFFFYVLIGIYMAWVGGHVAVIVYILQGVDAVILLQAVNYFEHYGLVRTEKKVRYTDSWDADSWMSRHAMIGMSRHADHHVDGSRPYHCLECSDVSPKLPYGYMGMAFLTIFRNSACREMLEKELRDKELGPFASRVSGPFVAKGHA